MKNSTSLKLAILSLFLSIGNNPLGAAPGKKYTLASPDGKLKVEISAGRQLTYQVMHEMEQVYINGQLVSEKDIQLLIKPSQYVTLGLNAEGNCPFTGLLHSLKLWD